MQVIRSHRSLAAFGGLVLAALVGAACSSGAAGSSPPSSATPSVSPSAPPSATPLEPLPSIGVDEPTGDVPALPPRRIVTPKPGQLDVHPIAAERFAATVTGRKVVVEIRYASGVEPCYVLDSIVVQGGDHGFAITLRQGHAPGDAVCIEIAENVRSFVDLGELDADTYTITDTQNGAPPLSVVVS